MPQSQTPTQHPIMRWAPHMAAMCLLPAIGVAGAKGLPLLICLVAAARLATIRPSQWIEKSWIFVLLLLAATSWFALSSLWSPYSGAFTQAAKLLALVPLGLIFATSLRREDVSGLAAAAVAAFVVLASLVLIESFWDLPLNRAGAPDAAPGEHIRNPMRGAVVALALSWGTAGILLSWKRKWAALAALAIGGVVSFQFDLIANTLGFFVGLAVFALATLWPRLITLATTFGLATWALAAPFLTPLILRVPGLVDHLPLSAAARAEIWTYACERILERPWFGHGLDAVRTVTDRIVVRGTYELRAIPLHPHSANLHIWYETGAVGAALTALTLVAGGLALARHAGSHRTAVAASTAAIACLGSIAAVGFGAWQEWWIATLFAAAFALRLAYAAQGRTV